MPWSGTVRLTQNLNVSRSTLASRVHSTRERSSSRWREFLLNTVEYLYAMSLRYAQGSVAVMHIGYTSSER